MAVLLTKQGSLSNGLQIYVVAVNVPDVPVHVWAIATLGQNCRRIKVDRIVISCFTESK